MLRPSGDALNKWTSKPSSSNKPRRHRRRRAVRGVDGDPEAAEPLRLRQRQARVRDVGVDDVSAFDRNVRGAADAPALVGDDRFDLALDVSLNFSPRPENTLMPLSWNGLCEAEMTSPAS